MLIPKCFCCQCAIRVVNCSKGTDAKSIHCVRRAHSSEWIYSTVRVHEQIQHTSQTVYGVGSHCVSVVDIVGRHICEKICKVRWFVGNLVLLSFLSKAIPRFPYLPDKSGVRSGLPLYANIPVDDA